MGGPAYNDSGCTGSAPLVMGAARGRRSFYLDADGVLRGVTYRWPWRDGENVAECMVTEVRAPMALSRKVPWGHLQAPYVMGGVVFEGDPEAPPVPVDGYKWARCTGLEATCACGFYAYHDAMSAYATSGPGCRVQAIVEGYGKVILGTQGYRAEKARIVAVAVPPPSAASTRRDELERTLEEATEALAAVQQVLGARWWRHSLVVAYVGVAATLAGLAAMAPGYRAGALAVAGFCLAAGRLSYRNTRNQLLMLQDQLNHDVHVLRESLMGLPEDYQGHVAKCRERYPSVKFFTTVEEMCAAYPVTSLRHLAVPEGPVPEETGQ